MQFSADNIRVLAALASQRGVMLSIAPDEALKIADILDSLAADIKEQSSKLASNALELDQARAKLKSAEREALDAVVARDSYSSRLTSALNAENNERNLRIAAESRLDAIRELLKDDEVGEWKELMALVNGTAVEKHLPKCTRCWKPSRALTNGYCDACMQLVFADAGE